MKAEKSFNALIDKIKLDQIRIDRIQSAHNKVRDFLSKSERLKNIYLKTYLQGSYIQNTAIKPMIDNEEFDVDVVLEVDWKDDEGNIKDKSKLKQKLKDALEDNEDYKNRILPHHRKRCITLNYAGDFHMDILPCHSNDDGTGIIWVYDSNDDWKESNPKSFLDWLNGIQKTTKLKDIIRLFKLWRNIQFGEKAHPKSILLSTMIGKCISNNQSLDMAFLETMKNIIDTYPEEDDDVPEIKNPGLKSENLADGISLTDYNRFIRKLKKAYEKAKKVLDEKESMQKVIDIWNSDEVFKGKLPNTSLEDQKEIDEILSYNRLQQQEKLFVSKTGILSSTVGVQTVPKARSWRDV